MADNTCHFGINSFFADNSLSDLQSWLYFPADAAQMNAIINRVSNILYTGVFSALL